MKEEGSLIRKRDGAICTLVINNPDKRNVLTVDCLLEIAETFDELSKDDGIRVVVIRGAGDRAFSAGYDIAALPSRSRSGPGNAAEEANPYERAIEAVGRYPYVVIAMLNGPAFGGGCELAITCDIRIAASHVRMGMPPAKIGLLYRYGGLRRFLTVLGYSRSLELFLTGRFYDSQKCLEMGLVNHVVEKDELESFTYDLARELTENAPLSLRGLKYIFNKIVAYPVAAQKDLEEFKSLLVQAYQSEDLEEGKRAFKEKRKPQFKGR